MTTINARFIKKWNRSSAFTPKQLAGLTEINNTVIAIAVRKFEQELANKGLVLTNEQKLEVYPALVNGITDGVHEFIESLKQ